MSKIDFVSSVVALIGAVIYFVSHVGIIPYQWKTIAVALIIIDVTRKIVRNMSPLVKKTFATKFKKESTGSR